MPLSTKFQTCCKCCQDCPILNIMVDVNLGFLPKQTQNFLPVIELLLNLQISTKLTTHYRHLHDYFLSLPVSSYFKYQRFNNISAMLWRQVLLM